MELVDTFIWYSIFYFGEESNTMEDQKKNI